MPRCSAFHAPVTNTLELSLQRTRRECGKICWLFLGKSGSATQRSILFATVVIFELCGGSSWWTQEPSTSAESRDSNASARCCVRSMDTRVCSEGQWPRLDMGLAVCSHCPTPTPDQTSHWSPDEASTVIAWHREAAAVETAKKQLMPTVGKAPPKSQEQALFRRRRQCAKSRRGLRRAKPFKSSSGDREAKAQRPKTAGQTETES